MRFNSSSAFTSNGRFCAYARVRETNTNSRRRILKRLSPIGDLDCRCAEHQTRPQVRQVDLSIRRWHLKPIAPVMRTDFPLGRPGGPQLAERAVVRALDGF